ncbi:abortive infection system antitoxin AbiGi family protein [Flavobacteriaceae bacterium]|nr:abortive infection system antitoxin AbiGi family protein [Flavobacteriaceae bacterium]
MREYINESLVHWTGRKKTDQAAFDILTKIIDSCTLLLSYCPNYTELPESHRTKTMMVCFTDLPLHLSEEHCNDFGKFGIGFNKENFIEYGANPVHYTTRVQLDRMKTYFDLLTNFSGLEVDREWKSEMEPYQFSTEQFYSMIELSGFTQEYDYKNKSINYYQREWRINYQTLPFTPGKKPQKPGHGSMHGNVGDKFMCEMLFDVNDISYIVVTESFKNEGQIVASKIGCDLKIYEIEVKKNKSI